jgi:hypothetical protein
MLIAVLAIALLVGVVSAATISYFGQVKMTANVTQAVLVDGHSYPYVIGETADVAGGESFCRYHWLTSQTSVPVTVLFETAYDPGLWDNEITTTIIPYMEVTGYDSEDPFLPTHYKKYRYLYDADTGTDGWQITTLNGIDTITYKYMVLGDSSGFNKPYVVLDLDTNADSIADIWIVEMMPPEAPSKDTWYEVTLDSGSKFHVPGTGWTQQSPGTLNEIKATYGSATVLKTSIAFGAFPGAETYKAYGGIIQVDTFSTQIDTLTLQPYEYLNFYICYKFDPLIEDGTYDIYTTIKPYP